MYGLSAYAQLPYSQFNQFDPVASASANLLSYYRMGDGDTFPTISDNKGSVDATMINMTAGDFEADVP